jgi:hypothetical protein
VLEQIAKECGGAFSKRRIHAGPGSGPMQREVTMTDRERVEAIMDLFQRVAIADESGNGEEADAECVADLFERAASGSGGKVGG